MLIILENLIPATQAKQWATELNQHGWEDGQRTGGTLSNNVKNNQQITEASPLGKQLGEQILSTLYQTPQFISAALPKTILPPRFNHYTGGGEYGVHVDGAIMAKPGTSSTIRTDLSITVFLTDANDYDGGELTIETGFGAQQVKLNAGDAVLYPSSSLHAVTPVTKGARISSFFWLQSMVRDHQQRAILYDLDQSIQTISASQHNSEEVVKLTGIYHNLLRQWAEM